MNKRAVILGAAESGVGAAILARKHGFDVFVSDLGSIKEKYKDAEVIYAGFNFSSTIINFIILSILLLLSAFASSSESAYFSLGPKEKENLKYLSWATIISVLIILHG